MKQINLSQRLSAAAAWVPLGARLCDVGTDHAALPIRLMQEGRVRRAIATDIRQGPLDRARGNVERYGYTGQIELRLCDGLAEVRREEVNAVTICGMGGNMIASILEAAPWTRERTDLILQPMKSQGELRSWLRDHGYRVNRERVLWDRERGWSGPPEKWIRTGWPICRTRCRNWRPGALFWKKERGRYDNCAGYLSFY